MNKIIALVALMAVSCCTSAAHAGAFGSSLLTISGAKIEKFVGGVWVNATSSDIDILSSSAVTKTSAFLEPAYSASSGNIPGFDAPQSFVSPTLAGPGPNSFVSYGNPLADSYARSDTDGSGASLIAVGGVSTKSISEVSSINSALGNAAGQTVGSGLFEIKVLKGGDYRLTFTGSVSLVTTAGASSFGTAKSDYLIQLNSNSLTFINNADSNLNKSISGNNSYSYSGLIHSNTVALAAESLNAFTITQKTAASVITPEPASLAVFGLLGIGALATRRRKA